MGWGVSAGDYRDLLAWQRAMDLVEGVYRATTGWPRDEVHGLINQVRRAAVSIPANIAEGHGSLNQREFLRYLAIAHGSCREVETHLLIARRLDYPGQPAHDQLLTLTAEVGRLLLGLINHLRRTLQPRA